MKITRRELGLAVTAAAVAADAQNPANNQAPDLDRAARETIARNSQTLEKFEIPIATEPAFQFKA